MPRVQDESVCLKNCLLPLQSKRERDEFAAGAGVAPSSPPFSCKKKHKQKNKFFFTSFIHTERVSILSTSIPEWPNPFIAASSDFVCHVLF